MFWALVAVAYFVGAIPFGVLVCKAHGIDLFAIGSGNIGATNVKRALGDRWGLIVWALDASKGLVPTLVARVVLRDSLVGMDPQTQWFLVGLAAVMGHCASPFLGFRGGKGISTALGTVVASAPLVAIACFALFSVVLAVTRYMAVASVVGVSSVVLFSWLIPGNTLQVLPVYVLLAGFVTYRHRSNFARMRAGTEPKFGFTKRAKPSLSDAKPAE